MIPGLAVSLLFIPGILAVALISRKTNSRLSSLDTILFGSIIWIYILVIPSSLLGAFASLSLQYFTIYNVFSLSIAVILAAYLLKTSRMNVLRNVKLRLESIPYLVAFLSLFTVNFVFMYFHSILQEWDAIDHYIPSAKAILASGGLTSNPFRVLEFNVESPAVPIMYAWIMNTSNAIFNTSSLDLLYNFAPVFFLLTVITIFLIAKRLFSGDVAIIPPIIFMSLPAVILVTGSRALYLDIPFLLFSLVALYSIMRIHEDSTLSNYVILGISVSLMILTRIEFAFLIVPVVLASLVFIKRPKHWEAIVPIIIGMSYLARESFNMIQDPSSSLFFFSRLAPLLILSPILFVFLKRFGTRPRVTHPSRAKLPLLIAGSLAIPAIVYLLRNLIVAGVVFPSLPIFNDDILLSQEFLRGLASSSQTSFVEELRWDKFLTGWWSVSAYLIPVVIGLGLFLSSMKGKVGKPLVIPGVIFFIGFFILMSMINSDAQPRRLYYFAPFLSLVVTSGLSKVRNYYSPLGFASRISIYAVGVIAAVLVKSGVTTVNDLALAYQQICTGDICKTGIDPEFLAGATLFFLLVFFPYERVFRNLGRWKFSRIVYVWRASKHLPLAGVLITLVMISSLVSVSFGPALLDTIDRGYQIRQEHLGGQFHYPDVIGYYNENISDRYVTVGFLTDDLITFANRPVIDLTSTIWGSPIYSAASTGDRLIILERMKELGVKYFLQPLPGHPSYATYEALVNQTSLGAIFVDNEILCYKMTFRFVDLYVLNYVNLTSIC